MKKSSPLQPLIRSYGRRLLLAAPAVLLTSFMLLLFGPIELLHHNSDAFIFHLDALLLPLAGVFIGALIAVSLLLALLRGRVFLHAVGAVFWLGICAYIQSAFLNPDTGLLTGASIDWSLFTANFIISLAVWLGVGLLLEVLLLCRARLWRNVVIYVSLALVIVMLVPTGMLLLTPIDNAPSIGEYTLDTSSLHEMSSGKNILVFVLDRLDFDYIENILAQQPDIFDGMDGFIGFDNAISSYARTKPALAHLLTGEDDIAYYSAPQDYLTSAWISDGKDVLGDLNRQGYDIELYTQLNYIFRDTQYPLQYVDNFVLNTGELLLTNALGKAYHLSLYRYAPSVLKPSLYADTTFYNDGVYAAAADTQPFAFNDAAFGARLSEAVIGTEANSFRLYHFYGTHDPYRLTADGLLSDRQTTAVEQGIGCFTLLQHTFDRMKELGVYDDAAIIITGDHGAAINDVEPVTKATRTGIFYKPSGSSGTPFRWSSAPVMTSNICATFMHEAGIDSAVYGTPLLDVAEDAGSSRPYYKTVHDPQTEREIGLYIYDVTGNAADFDNWHIIEYVDIDHSYY